MAHTTLLAVPPSPLNRSNHPTGWAALTEGLVAAQPPPSSVASQHIQHTDTTRDPGTRRLVYWPVALLRLQSRWQGKKELPRPPGETKRTCRQAGRQTDSASVTVRSARALATHRVSHGRSSCQQTPKRSHDRESDKVTGVAEIVTGSLELCRPQPALPCRIGHAATVVYLQSTRSPLQTSARPPSIPSDHTPVLHAAWCI